MKTMKMRITMTIAKMKAIRAIMAIIAIKAIQGVEVDLFLQHCP